ncbi:MAG: hypothetical protein A3F54_01925 [Candidatus Kerfeldbacteria bacterium RIFCSPHIGHO2_12_FULL_48_17]|uniref:Uncharacterized protein n=1 Tax=Candidatus Kerfeldbacteria bacterium RIFCSPHIGHO2_12_FULL_48_17 TaxID=1798542 RepID=A0A1G2AWT0_9BACT|nr:MAG: hypothetical protein A3F54_01925 [Candidatus Kerfeldbacteria bacterium RIFCSPHIGHO2_12_FULL_48_17]
MRRRSRARVCGEKEKYCVSGKQANEGLHAKAEAEFGRERVGGILLTRFSAQAASKLLRNQAPFPCATGTSATVAFDSPMRKKITSHQKV